jgi:uncharacterized protein (DUF362 family)
MDRREFLKAAGGGIILAAAGGPDGPLKALAGNRMTRVSIIKTNDRSTGVRKAVELLDINPVTGKEVLVKPNFNTADAFPASTHNDTLRHLILTLKDMDASGFVIGDRSGPADTADVLRDKGIHELAKEIGAGVINFEELPSNGWVEFQPKGSHWRRGFRMARRVVESPCVATTCCLKTHRYGGVFTMSLKLSIGAVHRGNMTELHSSFRSQRKMIAEVNTAYSPSLILMDGIECFTDGGPMSGERKHAGVIVAGTDRIAVDAVGLAVLKDLGSNSDIMRFPIFKQEQIARAVELELGISGPEQIELVTGDAKSKVYAERLKGILAKG